MCNTCLRSSSLLEPPSKALASRRLAAPQLLQAASPPLVLVRFGVFPSGPRSLVCLSIGPSSGLPLRHSRALPGALASACRQRPPSRCRRGISLHIASRQLSFGCCCSRQLFRSRRVLDLDSSRSPPLPVADCMHKSTPGTWLSRSSSGLSSTGGRLCVRRSRTYRLGKLLGHRSGTTIAEGRWTRS